jgi:antitoxin MazE
MQGSVSRWGNSLALRLPSAVASSLNMREGTQVEIRVEDHSIVITPSKPRYRLADLLAGYDPDKHRHGEMDDGGPIGREVW